MRGNQEYSSWHDAVVLTVQPHCAYCGGSPSERASADVLQLCAYIFLRLRPGVR